MPAVAQNLAENLRHLCGLRRSVAAVSRDLDINRTQFNRYLVGSARPSAHSLNRIAVYFGVEPHELFLPHLEFLQVLAPARRNGAAPSRLAIPFRPPSAEELGKLQKYLGYYRVYYNSMSRKNHIVRGIVNIFQKNREIHYRWIEHDRSETSENYETKWRYSGYVYCLSDRIFLIGFETMTHNEIVEAVIYPAFKNRIGRLTGLLLGVGSSDRREIVCSRLVMEPLPQRTNLREAVRGCGIFPATSSVVPRAVLESITTGHGREPAILNA